MILQETAYAKLNLALHVRGKLADGRHRLETVFAFCEDGDLLEGETVEAPRTEFSLSLDGPFSQDLDPSQNLSVESAWVALTARLGISRHTRLRLDKRLPVASGIGGGSADAGATLRLLTRLWQCAPGEATAVAPRLGSDVPACLVSAPCRGTGAGDYIEPIESFEASGTPVLLVNPRVPLSTREVFARWDGVDRGPLGNWREGRNDLEAAAVGLVPQIADVVDWLRGCVGVDFVRMSGSGATCFALFASDTARDSAASVVPQGWWHLATRLR